jgi:hypothetical protein
MLNGRNGESIKVVAFKNGAKVSDCNGNFSKAYRNNAHVINDGTINELAENPRNNAYVYYAHVASASSKNK